MLKPIKVKRMYRLVPIVFLLFFASCNMSSTRQSGNSENQEASNMEQLAATRFDYAVDYGDALDLLDKTDLNSIDLAIAAFKKSTPDSVAAQSLSADSMLVVLTDFIQSVVQTYDETNLNGNVELINKLRNDADNADVTGFKERLDAHGIALTSVNDDFFLEIKYSFLLNVLKNNLSNTSKRFMELKVNDERKPLVVDEKLIFSPDTIAVRLMQWEDFVKANPAYISVHDAENRCSDFLTLMLSGTEENPVFDLDTKLVVPEFKIVYEKYINQNPERSSTLVIKRFYDLLAETGFKYNEKIDSFLSENVTQ